MDDTEAADSSSAEPHQPPAPRKDSDYHSRYQGTRQVPAADSKKQGKSASGTVLPPQPPERRNHGTVPDDVKQRVRNMRTSSADHTAQPPPLPPRGKPKSGTRDDDVRVTEDPMETDSVFRVWRMDHPNATPEEIGAEMHRRWLERIVPERSARIRELRKWEDELTALVREEDLSREMAELERKQREWREREAELQKIKSLEAQGSTEVDHEEENRLVPKPPPRHSRKREAEAQRSAWDEFMRTSSQMFSGSDDEGAQAGTDDDGDSRSNSTAAVSQDMVALSQITGEKPDVLQYSAKTEDSVFTHSSLPMTLGSRGIVTREWKFQTDRFENAALAVQCAYRRSRSRRLLKERRLIRERVIANTLAMEAELQDYLDSLEYGGSGAASSAASLKVTAKALDRWKNFVEASAVKRKLYHSREARSREELRHYAATRLQALYRGNRTRAEIFDLLNPEVADARRLDFHNFQATMIQALWRGMRCRMLVQRMRVGILPMQRLYRRWSAICRLHHLRMQHMSNDHAELQHFSARCLQRFFRRLVARRLVSLNCHKDKFEIINRVGRGYAARRGMGGIVALLNRQLMSCVIIQRNVRKMIARTRCVDRAAAVMAYLKNEEVKLFHNVRTIQCMVRCHQARSRYQERLRVKSGQDEVVAAETEQHAARVIQRSMHRVVDKRAGEAILEAKRQERAAVLEEQHSAKGVAAAQIQRIYRGFLGRQRCRHIKKRILEELQYNKERDAAIVIQSLYRGYNARVHLTNVKWAVPVLQDLARVVASRRRMWQRRAELHQAHETRIKAEFAVKIQRAVRIRLLLHQRFVWRINHSARVITRFIRSVPGRRIKVERQRKILAAIVSEERLFATLRLQAWGRQLTAKRRIDELLHERSEQQDVLRREEAAKVVSRFIRDVPIRRQYAEKARHST